MTRTLADGKLLLDEPSQGIVRLTISNPEKRNALDHPILDAISSTVRSLAAGLDPSESDRGRAPGEDDRGGPGEDDRGGPGVRCLLITGAGGMFSAGYDIAEIPAPEFEHEAEQLIAHPFTEALDAIDAFPLPTLAVMPGHTIGGGLELALACDLRLAEHSIKLGMPPAKLGLVYSHTGLRRFIDAIGAPRTRELFLLGTYIDAPTALAWGLVNRLAPADELQQAGLELATAMAAGAPLAQRGNKRVIAALLDSQATLEGPLERELMELRRASFASEDMREGIAAFAEKRRPSWRGR